MNLDDLAAEIAANPDDDAPRLAWADAVGGERGELVVLQCDLARGGFELDETVARRRRERELLRRHGRAWTPPNIDRAEFHRGFLRTLVVGGRWASEIPPDAMDVVLAGVLEAKIVRRALDRLAHPRSVDLQVAGSEDHGLLLRAPKFRDLVGLGVSWPLTPHAVELIAHHHPKLAHLWVHCPTPREVVTAIARRLPRLTTLHLVPNNEMTPAVFELPLVELALPFGSTDVLERLADGRAGRTLERLVVPTRRDNSLWPLDHLPKLRALTVDFVDAPAHAPFLDLELRALRELTVWFDRDPYSGFDHQRLVWRWGSQLEKLALRTDDKRLPERLAGELVRAEDELAPHRPQSRQPRGALVEVSADPPCTHPLRGDRVELHDLLLEYRSGRFQLKANAGTRVVVNHAALEWRAIDLYDRDEILVGDTRLVYRRTATDAAAVEHAARWKLPW